MANLTGANLEDLLLEDLQANVAYQISCTTAGTTTVTSSAAFSSVTVGMKVFGTGIPAGTTVTAIASTSSLTISIAATDSTTTTRSFAADPPLTLGPSGQTYLHLNDAYASLWDMWGGSITRATSATLWTPDQTADTTGVLTGDLTTVSEILHLWATTTSGSTGGGSGDVEVEKTDLSEIHWLRQTYSTAPYLLPQKYCVTMQATSTAADVNKWRLDFWPGISGYYFPAWYIPHFTALAATTDVPDLPDLAQRDMAHLGALNIAPLIGRTDLVDAIQKKISEKTRLLMARRESALVDARQDR